MPSPSGSLGYSPRIGVLLAVYSFTQFFDQIISSHFSVNRESVETLALVLAFVSSVSILNLRGLAPLLPPLIIFSLLYGIFYGGYMVLWAEMGLELRDDPTVARGKFRILAFLIERPISAHSIDCAVSASL